MKLFASLLLVCLAYVVTGLAMPSPDTDMAVSAEGASDSSAVRNKRHLLLHAKLLGLGILGGGAAKLAALSHVYGPGYYVAPPYARGYEHYERYYSNGLYG